MLPGIEAHNANARTHIADILGLNGFSANEVVANLKGSWSNLSAVRLRFPGMESGSQVYPEVMARALQVPAQRKEFALRLREAAGDAEYLGMPAIMGIYRPDEVHADLERLSGVRLFELPTMPPSIAGIRLREMFEQVFPERGLVLVPQQKVEQLELDADGGHLRLKDSYGSVSIRAETMILATGRFLSGGLQAGRDQIREPLLGVPVSQPAGRDGWYRDRYFDPRGHQVNRAGIEVDDRFRPLGEQGEPISERLFSAGILLAHQDWIRQRCGAGVAIASAYKAVAGAAGLLA
jgi:glycerol-3-phosphate dehydrogenase subunit B